MASLEDQYLSGKSAGYCSSSSDDDDEDNEPNDSGQKTGLNDASESRPFSGTSVNTGPKGVIEDWRRFKQLQTERRAEQEKELMALAQKLSLSCRSHLDDEKAKEKESEADLLKDLENDDDFVKEYMKRRMNELAANFLNKPSQKFGKVFELVDVDAFLNAVEQDSKNFTVVVHLYEKNVNICETVNGCLVSLAENYPSVKFCRVRVSILGASKKFRSKGLPTLQAYRDGQLIGNFVRFSDELGEDFFADDVESFLKQYGILPDISTYESILNVKSKDFASSSKENKDDSDLD